MTELESEEIKHQIYLEQYKTGEVNKIIKIIDKANNQVKKALKETKGVYTKQRYTEINRLLKNLSKELKENISNSTDINGIIDYELRKQKKLFNIGTENINVDFMFPSVDQVRKSALFNPVTDTMTFQSYLEGIQQGFYTHWDSAIRTGYLTSETTNQIIKNVMGSVTKPLSVMDKGQMQTFKNSVTRNTRTVLQAFASETRREIYNRNSRYIKKVKYLSTLDRRTCLVCAEKDGKIFNLDEAPELPIHYNCRCVLVPVIVGIETVSDTRPMENGVTEGSVTYPEWLEKQSDEVQREILGASRYKLYKNGNDLDVFTENNNVLTLEELNKKL